MLRRFELETTKHPPAQGGIAIFLRWQKAQPDPVRPASGVRSAESFHLFEPAGALGTGTVTENNPDFLSSHGLHIGVGTPEECRMDVPVEHFPAITIIPLPRHRGESRAGELNSREKNRAAAEQESSRHTWD
jgi:hypothetical protein